MTDINLLPTPFYIVYETRLRRNLELIKNVSQRAEVEIIMAFKANALWKTFPIFREYAVGFTASSLNEMMLGNEELRCRSHTYCVAYTDDSVDAFIQGSSHMTFNSVEQWQKYKNRIDAHNICHPDLRVSPGLRVNPRCSVIETDIYNPAKPGSRFGVSSEILGESLPEGIDGFHFHQLCESTSYDLEKVLDSFEKQFGRFLPSLKWVNMGGGHLMTKEGYDIDHLVKILREFKSRYPHLDVILEPGSAFTWRTGDLITSVVDIVEDSGIKTAIIDASFACHMPDTLEMPYQPIVSESDENGEYSYRLGGNSCLSGDYVGDWHFAAPLKSGQRLTLEDMNHYTTVKTNMFNGLHHPDIVFCGSDGSLKYLRRYDYADYKSRMD